MTAQKSLTASQLREFIDNVVGDNDPNTYEVYVIGRDQRIAVASVDHNIVATIHAPQLFKHAEVAANDDPAS
jgi:hypothetical protein